MNRRSKGLIAASTIVFLVLGVLAILNTTKLPNKTFGLDNFYVGTLGKETDPKVLYDKMQANIIAEAIQCHTIMKKSKKSKIAGDIIWFAEGSIVSGPEDVKKLRKDENNKFVLKPFEKEGQLIVAPVKLDFVNSNLEQSINGGINIVVNIKDQFQIVFQDVKSWWCHIGASEQNKHTMKVGNGGYQSSCDKGYVIGEAKKDTLVSLFRLSDTGERAQPCVWKELIGW